MRGVPGGEQRLAIPDGEPEPGADVHDCLGQQVLGFDE